MAKVIEKENLIKLGRGPVVVLPLKKWKEFEKTLEDLKDAVRFQKAISDPKNQRLIPFEKVKKMLKLP